MSRTTRKTKWYVRHSDVSFINRELRRWYRHPYKTKKVRKTQEQYEADFARAEQAYRERVAANAGSTIERRWSAWSKSWYEYEIPKAYASRYTYIRVEQTREECTQEAIEYRKRLQRDQCYNETVQNTGFKKEANKTVRRANKNFCRAVIADDDYEDMAYPIHKEGKYAKWNWW